MPRSKRDKKISLTKTSKKPGLEFKQRLVDDVRNSIEKYDSIYHFTYENLNNDCISSLRKIHWTDSRFYFGKNRVLQLGLGKTIETEAGPKLHRLSKHLSGQSGLLCTNRPYEEVTSWFNQHTQPCLAQAGSKATKTVKLKTGPLTRLTFAVEPYVRKLGLSTELKNGQINLLQDYVVCSKGEVIKTNNAKLLKVLGHNVGTFQMILKRWWSKEDGTCKKIAAKPIDTCEIMESEEVEVESENDDPPQSEEDEGMETDKDVAECKH